MSQKKFFNLRLPFFLPLWRRVLTTGVLTGWTGVEIWGQNMGWAILFGACAAYTAYEFFIAFDPINYEDNADR
ncbi:MAG: hypothetical protein P8P56_14835 [Yoonia sp.]|nr:hypothetical protein [Yoonia sp.]